jgi:MFS transporter, FHS family, L-fucose permease
MPIPSTLATSTEAGAGTTKKYLLPFILVTSLFFLWGLANSLNGALTAHFQPVFQISRAQSLLVETAFYLGYFTIALPAGFFMERFGYKKGIILGLSLFAVGAFLFIPAAKFLTFGFFLIALYVIASGLAFLETGANPYVMMLGSTSAATQRLNFAQSFNGLATVTGPWIAGQFIFSGNEGAMSTIVEKQAAADAVIFPYAMIGTIVLVVALMFVLVKMPEPNKGPKLKFDASIFKNRRLVFAVIAQLFYVGAQVGLWGITINYVTELIPGTSKELASKQYVALSMLLFVIGRVVGTALMSFIKDHKLLLFYSLIASALCLIGVVTGGETAVYSVLAISFFMSIMFPTIFALGIKDLGNYAKLGSSLIIMSIVGGAILPPMMGLIADKIGLQQSLYVPMLCFLVVFAFAWKGHDAKA